MKGSVKLPVFIDDARKYVNTTQLRAKYLGASYEAEYCQWQALHGLGSLMETASLIITPNAYLEGKLIASYPPDPIGDFDVTRATTATRVNSAGLVELVPYNLFTYSEQFDNADWSKSSGAITANSTTAPNGTTTADTFTGNGALSNHDFFEGVTGGANTTASIYVKKNTAQYVYISLNYQSSGVNWATGVYDLDNLTTATFQSGGVTNQVATITDEGNGWRRITLSVDTANTSLYCMYGLADSMSPTLGSRGRVENSSSQSFYAWGAQLVEGSTAKDYQKTETRLNIPRLDYSNGTCPSLLVEPQRTNVCLYSNDLSGWIDQTLLTTKTRIQTGGPDGNAFDRLVTTGSGYVGRYVQSSTQVGSNTCFTTYLRGSGTIQLGVFNMGTTYSVSVNLTNEWVRYENIITNGTNGTYMDFGIYLFGGVQVDVAFSQVEFASYPTSYIPTTSASVTRNADVIGKSGITSLIGQTEGTLFVDLDLSQIETQALNIDTLMLLNDGTTNNEIGILLDVPSGNPRTLLGLITSGGTYQTLIYDSSIATETRYKIAFAYKANDVVMYINGQLIGTDTSASIPNTYHLSLSKRADGSWTNDCQTLYNATALWKTRLTNTQLAELTSL